MAGLTVNAVLLDSGGVLIGPVGGRWNPRVDFEEVVGRRVGDLPADLLSAAIAAGDAFLAAAERTPSRDEYHRVVLDVLDVEASPALLAELDAPLDPATVVEPYPEVIEVLNDLGARGPAGGPVRRLANAA